MTSATRLLLPLCLALSLATPSFAVPSDHRPFYGDCGLDLTGRDAQVKPGNDFYTYANGHWVQTFTLPADRASYGMFTHLEELSDERTHTLIEEAAAAHAAPGTAQQRVGDYFAAFMDTRAIEAHGLAPIQPVLDQIAAAQSPQAIATLFAEPGVASPIGLGITTDMKDPNRYRLELDQSGLGLPDREYYLSNDPKLKEIRAKYHAYIEQMFSLAGLPDGAANADHILAFETEIAKASWSREQLRNVTALYNPRTKAEIISYAPGLDWQAFFTASEIPNRQHFNLGEPTAIRGIAAALQHTDLATIKAYLTFHYISDNASCLPKPFDDAHFAFYGTVMSGQPSQRARWKRGVAAVNGAIGEEIGRLYVQRYFPAEAKAKMQALVALLRRSLAHRIQALDWMSPATKQKALAKLAAMNTKIGYPDKWKDYSALVVRRDDPIGNARRAMLWEWHRELARLDQPVDRQEWDMTPQTVNAYYDPSKNEIVFPAAILQPPFFDPNADAAVNFGGIGAVIGHEMTHGFDDEGRKFGPTGAMTDWWTPADAKAFAARTQKLVKEYDGFEALPGLHLLGAVTLGENIADLGGLNIAFDAYHMSLHGRTPPVIDGLTGDQRFFYSFAQIWRQKEREPALRRQVLTDFHSPAYFRVDGTVPNIPGWYAAFGVKPGDKLYRAPADRIRIW